MYDNHVPTIAGAMRSDPVVFARGVTFVVLTIQQMIVTIPDSVADVDAKGDQSVFLFGSKRVAFAYLQAHRDQLWQGVCNAEDTASAIRTLCAIPGLGIVKSAFVCQLMGFDVGCLDTRNIQREGRNPLAYRSRKGRPGYMVKKTLAYVADTAGKAREYWDVWCADAARAYKRTSEDISAIHLDCIVPASRSFAPIAVPCCGTPEIIDDCPF